MRIRWILGLATFLVLGCGELPSRAAGGEGEPSSEASSEVSAGEPTATVLAFNQAVSDQDRGAALGLLAEGSVQFNLRPSHAGMGTDEDTGLTQDLTAMWSVVTGVLFARLESYVRSVEPTGEQVSGDVATVWTRTRTESREPGADAPSVIEFTEAYLLLRLDGAWRIAGVANNRPTTGP